MLKHIINSKCLLIVGCKDLLTQDEELKVHARLDEIGQKKEKPEA